MTSLYIIFNYIFIHHMDTRNEYDTFSVISLLFPIRKEYDNLT